MIATLLDEAAVRVPKYATQIKAAKPYAIMVENGINQAWPYCVKAYEGGQKLWVKLQPYDPEQFFPLLFGLVLCFFGGSYLTLIATVEAIRLTVWDRMVKAVKTIYEQYKTAKEASEKDDQVDADGDGIADVKQISKKELATRKAYLVLKVVHPEQLSEALGLLWGAWLSVVATLRVQFAQSVTLGCSIGGMLHTNFDKNLQPVIHQALPPDLKKWAPTISSYLFKSLGVTFAWFMQRIISGFHSAIRGGNLFATNAIRLAKKHGYLDASFEEDSPRTSVVATVIAIIGFYWQFSNGFALPFPLNLLMLPVTILEWVIEFWVGV